MLKSIPVHYYKLTFSDRSCGIYVTYSMTMSKKNNAASTLENILFLD